MTGRVVTAALLGGAVIGLAACSGGSPPAEVAATQRALGADVFARRCVACHQPGGIGVELTAATIAARGDARLLAVYLRTSMPYDEPGALSGDEYWAVTAYLLASLGLLPPDVRLSGENAADIPLMLH